MDYECIDLSMYLPQQQILVFSDFHLGYEEALQRRGVLVPRFQLSDTLERLEKIFTVCEQKKYVVKKIIINGDLKHEFGKISAQEWREILKLIDFFLARCKQLIIIQGNHDVILSPVVKKRMVGKNILFEKYHLEKDILFVHGDVLPEKYVSAQQLKKIKTIIIGNEHPAIALQDKGRIERFKCFLVGKWKRKQLFVLPSFQLLTTGTDILREKNLSPYLDGKLDAFKVYIVSDEQDVLDFGTIKKLRNL